MPPPPPTAASENNRSVAAALRARLAGSLGGGAQQPAQQAAAAAPPPPREPELLPVVGEDGRAAPGAFGRRGVAQSVREVERAHGAPGGRAPKGTVQRYGADGRRERYFADDGGGGGGGGGQTAGGGAPPPSSSSGPSVAELYARSKYGDDPGAQDMDRAAARAIARAGGRYRGDELDPDAEYDHDAGLELFDASAQQRRVSRRDRRGDAGEAAARRDRERQASQMRRAQRGEQQCPWCVVSPARAPQRDLVVAVGTRCYLTLAPARRRLAPGHCVIAAAEHVASCRAADDALWTEVRNFQKCLVQFWQAGGLDRVAGGGEVGGAGGGSSRAAPPRDVLFFETAVRLTGDRRHALMDAVPLDAEASARAPLVFRQAFAEAESEWAQHASKACLEVPPQKGLRASIPLGFPYAYAQFGWSRAFLHVVDDEARYDAGLARQAAAGVLRLAPEAAAGRRGGVGAAAGAGGGGGGHETPEQQRALAAAFRKAFEPFDWTRQLEE
jgi:hypothetical protein